MSSAEKTAGTADAALTARSPVEFQDPTVERMMRAAVAGAKTGEPSEADLDRLVAEAMGDMDPAELSMQNLPAGRHRNEGGGLKRGRITRVTKEDVFIDLGGKS